MVAVLEGRTDLIEVFLRHNARVDVGDSQQGRTCLHFAAEFGRVEIIKLLVVGKSSLIFELIGTYL